MKLTLTLILAGFTGCALASPPTTEFHPYEIAESRFVKPREADSRGWLDRLLQQPEFSLEDFLMVVDRFHPQLEVERGNVDLVVAEAWEAQLYPNPTAFAGVEELGSGGFGSSKRTLGVAIPLVIGGRLGSARSLVDKERELAALNYVWKRRELLSGAKQAFVRHLAAKQEALLSKATRDIATSLHDVTNERFKAQSVPEMELLKAAVNLATAEADLRNAESQLAISAKHLQAYMGNVDFPKDRFAGELASRYTVPSLEALRGQVTALHPLTEASVKAKEVAELRVAHARAQATPDLAIQFAAGAGTEGDFIVDAGVEIPLALFNRNQSGIASAEIRLRQAEVQIQAVRTELLLRLMESYKTFATAQDRVRVYQEEILPKARKALDQTNEGHRLGKFGYLDVLDAQRTLAESTRALTAALADLNLAASDVETLTGMRLEVVR